METKETRFKTTWFQGKHHIKKGIILIFEKVWYQPPEPDCSSHPENMNRRTAQHSKMVSRR